MFDKVNVINMASSVKVKVLFGHWRYLIENSYKCQRFFSANVQDPEKGLAKTFDMFKSAKIDDSVTVQGSQSQKATEKTDPRDSYSFARLLKESPLIQLGDPNGKIITGTIIEEQDNHIYIDFGGKFHCVCQKPQMNSQSYKRGEKVRIRLHALELAARFLGGTRDNTLLEADATLLGLVRDTGDDR